jgi:hypothetical protein
MWRVTAEAAGSSPVSRAIVFNGLVHAFLQVLMILAEQAGNRVEVGLLRRCAAQVRIDDAPAGFDHRRVAEIVRCFQNAPDRFHRGFVRHGGV